eukprot:Em0023g683a
MAKPWIKSNKEKYRLPLQKDGTLKLSAIEFIVQAPVLGLKFKNDDMWNLLLPNAEHIIEEPDGGWQNIEYTVCKKADEPLEEEQGRTLQRLPPLEPFSLSSTQAHSDHDPATIELKHLEMPGEAIVLKLQKYQIYDTWNVDYLHYYNETDIRNYVAEVLRMIIYALKLKDVEVRCVISVFELRPDLWLVQRRHNHNHFTPIGVVEVKRPAVDLMPSPLGNGKVLGQLYDYLVMLKTQFDLNFAIGIVTTYKEWRICWLQEDDSIITTLSHENDAVQAVSSEIVPEISMQDEKDDDDDQSAEKSTSPRCLCGTDIMTIHPDSTEVIVSVASAINKMLQVKTLSSRLIRKNREYFVYSKSGLARFGGGVLVPGLHASHILARVVVLLVAAGQCNAVGGGDSDAGGGKVSAAAGGGSAAGGGGSAAAQMWFASRKQEIRPTDQSGIPILLSIWSDTSIMLALWISLALISLVSGQVCNPYTNRVDCGYVGITEGQCQSKGCCWYPTDNVPWCFFKSGGQPSCKPDALRNDCDALA